MKISNFLKRSLFIGVLIISTLKVYSNEIIIRKDDPTPPDPWRPNCLSLLYSVTATEDDSELAVYFEEAVGDATITVYNVSNQVVYQTVINTNTQSAAIVDVSAWSTGDYTLTISYGTTSLIGEFTIE